ncbi:TNF receptor-associated factor 6 [Halotydeus destructor]|nr:TNF receptor-associated factor 6 [Halotydeus destructor]
MFPKSVDTSKEDFKCPLCQELLREPVQCPEGHAYCNLCIRQWIADKGPGCPVGGESLTPQDLTSAGIINYLMSQASHLVASCPNVKLGCPTLNINLRDLKDHLEDSCAFAPPLSPVATPAATPRPSIQLTEPVPLVKEAILEPTPPPQEPQTSPVVDQPYVQLVESMKHQLEPLVVTILLECPPSSETTQVGHWIWHLNQLFITLTRGRDKRKLRLVLDVTSVWFTICLARLLVRSGQGPNLRLVSPANMVMVPRYLDDRVMENTTIKTKVLRLVDPQVADKYQAYKKLGGKLRKYDVIVSCLTAESGARLALDHSKMRLLLSNSGIWIDMLLVGTKGCHQVVFSPNSGTTWTSCSPRPQLPSETGPVAEAIRESEAKLAHLADHVMRPCERVLFCYQDPQLLAQLRRLTATIGVRVDTEARNDHYSMVVAPPAALTVQLIQDHLSACGGLAYDLEQERIVFERRHITLII